MERKKLTLTLLVISVFIGLMPFVISQTSVETYKADFDAKANVSLSENVSKNASLGVAPGSSEGLDFGNLPLQFTRQARKSLEMDASKKSLVIISSSGNASKYMIYNKSHYFEGSKQVEVAFETEDTGYYTGTLHVKTMTPKNELGERWINLRSQLPYWSFL
jgi:hypothetical protein